MPSIGEVPLAEAQERLRAVTISNGILVSIMSAGTEFRETKKSEAFRTLVESRGGWFKDLPDRSFAEVGTNVNTILCVIGRRKGW